MKQQYQWLNVTYNKSDIIVCKKWLIPIVSNNLRYTVYIRVIIQSVATIFINVLNFNSVFVKTNLYRSSTTISWFCLKQILQNLRPVIAYWHAKLHIINLKIYIGLQDEEEKINKQKKSNIIGNKILSFSLKSFKFTIQSFALQSAIQQKWLQIMLNSFEHMFTINSK